MGQYSCLCSGLGWRAVLGPGCPCHLSQGLEGAETSLLHSAEGLRGEQRTFDPLGVLLLCLVQQNLQQTSPWVGAEQVPGLCWSSSSTRDSCPVPQELLPPCHGSVG